MGLKLMIQNQGLLQLRQAGTLESYSFSEPIPLGYNLHRCFSAFFPYFSASFFFHVRLGSGKIVSLESKHMFSNKMLWAYFKMVTFPFILLKGKYKKGIIFTVRTW